MPLPDLTDPQSVAQLQLQLSQATGQYINADGGLGPTTHDGIELFQRINGLDPTGTLDQPTYDALNQAVPPGSLTDLSDREFLHPHNDAPAEVAADPNTYMQVITPEQLCQVMPHCKLAKAQEVIYPLNLALREFDIITTKRVAAFIANVAVETGEQFSEMVELTSGWEYDKSQNPSKAAALGNTEVGDGPRFKGRGALQITGRTNYRKVGTALGVDLETHPERAADYDLAFRTAGWYWRHACVHDCNRLADIDDFAAIVWMIDGGQLITDRRAHLAAWRWAAEGHPEATRKSVTDALLRADRPLYADSSAFTGRFTYYRRALQLDIEPVTTRLDLSGFLPDPGSPL